MKLEEAISLIGQVICGITGKPETGFKGTLQEHQLLQQALKVVNEKCSDKKKDEVDS